MSRALIRHGRWLSKLGLGMNLLSGEVMSTFGTALAINSMQVWPNAATGLREMLRVMKPGGEIALGFTPYSGQPNQGMKETLIAAGFTKAHVVETSKGFCVLATKP